MDSFVQRYKRVCAKLKLFHLYWHKIGILNAAICLFLYIWSGVMRVFVLMLFAFVVSSTSGPPHEAGPSGACASLVAYLI